MQCQWDQNREKKKKRCNVDAIVNHGIGYYIPYCEVKTNNHKIVDIVCCVFSTYVYSFENY